MGFIDRAIYRAACASARELVDPIILLEAIDRVYEMWIADKRAGKQKIVFHAYFGLSLLDLGIDQLYEAEQYRKALAAYFQPRALLRLRKLREARRETPVRVPQNNVEFANSKRVRIRIDEHVSFEFKAIRSSGPLKWRHLDEVKIIHIDPGTVSDEDRHHARKQALMVLNNVRERMCKKKSE